MASISGVVSYFVERGLPYSANKGLRSSAIIIKMFGGVDIGDDVIGGLPGRRVGYLVGVMVGLTDGDIVVGSKVGSLDGNAVGNHVGSAVG